MIKLNILKEDSKPDLPLLQLSKRTVRKNKLQSEWNHYWKNIESLPSNEAWEHWIHQVYRENILRYLGLPGKKALDIGCGMAPEYSLLSSKNIEIDLLDVSTLALSHCKKKYPQAKTIHECVPFIRLEDRSYETLFCFDLISEVEENYLRLSLNEFARLLPVKGHLVLSASLDYKTKDPLKKLIHLVETEFEITHLWTTSLQPVYTLSRFFNFHESPEKIKKRFRKWIPKIQKPLMGFSPTYVVMIGQKKGI